MERLNPIHIRALRVLIITILVDIIIGTIFGLTVHVGVWEGLFYTTGIAVTAGADIVTPRGWIPHVLTVLIFISCVPLFTATFALVTAGFTASHIDKRHKEAMDSHGEIKEILNTGKGELVGA